jgi:phosphoglycerate dehydrogenase-like enzyme
MRIFMIGEAAKHAEKLAEALQTPCPIVPLPRAAALDEAADADIMPEDVVISLRFQRPPGAAPEFSLLHVPGAGLDGIALDALHPGTAVCNVFEHEIPIAEYVLASMLELSIDLQGMRARFSPGRWAETYRNRVAHDEIHGGTMGLIGFGRIGRAIALRARAFGLRILAVDAAQGDPGPADALLPPERLNDVLAAADWLVIACPLTKATHGLIDAQALARMKKSAVLINISRAEIADQAALYAALRDERIGGAVLDVWYRYPQTSDDTVRPADFPFHELPNVVCTPHSSAWTRDLPYRRYRVIASNIDRLRHGEPLINLVRAPVAAAKDPNR